MASATGGYCTHGEVILDDDIVTQEQQDNAVLWWAKGGKLKGQSPERIKFLRKVFESLPGPVDPYETGFGRMLSGTPEEIKAAAQYAPEHMKGFIGAIASMDQRELLVHAMPETEYFGHVGENVYIFYYDINCCARVRPQLPAGKTFKMEIIDAWNMTREVAATGFKNGDELKLPGREYIAVLATAK